MILEPVLSPVQSLTMVLAVMALWSCTADLDEGKRPVARAFEDQLLWSDLRQVIPFEISKADSAALAQQYIRNWLRQRAVLHQAELNLAVNARDFEEQLRDYRNSLVIYAYEQALVQQKLDTVVHSMEMEEYHTRNGSNFELTETIMRVRWAKVRENDKRIIKRLEEHFLSGATDRMHELEMWLAQRGAGFIDRGNTWINDAELHQNLALGETDRIKLPASQGRTVHRAGSVTIFLEILELRNNGEIAPLELVEEDIRSIIINQRKLQLLERMREDLYREALEQQHLEVL